MSARDLALDDLWSHCEKLQADELRVLSRIAKRLVAGADVYGVLKLSNDQRDMIRETTEELLDATVYLACETIRREGVIQ